MPRNKFCARGFALYEVMIGVTIFVVGILALGRSVENCLNASEITTDENRIRIILSNRMAEIQTSPGNPDASKEMKIKSDFGTVRLIQKSVPAGLKQEEGIELGGLRRVLLTAEWSRGRVKQSKQVSFYVYRAG
jgi:Tfp pilus assembly protein PilV